MIAAIQRVREARAEVPGRVTGATGAVPAALGQALADHRVAPARRKPPQVATGGFGAVRPAHRWSTTAR